MNIADTKLEYLFKSKKDRAIGREKKGEREKEGEKVREGGRDIKGLVLRKVIP